MARPGAGIGPALAKFLARKRPGRSSSDEVSSGTSHSLSKRFFLAPQPPLRRRREVVRPGAVGGAFNQDRQFQIGPAGEIERHLLEAQKTVRRVIEGPLAAFAPQHAMLIPQASEVTALPAQIVNDEADCGVVQMRAHIGAELRNWAQDRSNVIVGGRLPLWRNRRIHKPSNPYSRHPTQLARV